MVASSGLALAVEAAEARYFLSDSDPSGLPSRKALAESRRRSAAVRCWAFNREELDMKARLAALIAVIALAVPVVLALPTNAFASSYIQYGHAYWVHPNGSFANCWNCSIRIVNDSNGNVFTITTGPNSVTPNYGAYQVILNYETQYHMYLTYSTNMFTPIKFQTAHPIPMVSGQCTYTHTLQPTIKVAYNQGAYFELHLYGGANEYGCPAYPQG
jgi:hypothetical protein